MKTELLCLPILRNLSSITLIFCDDPRSFLYSSSLEVTDVIFSSIFVNVFEVLHLKIPIAYLVNSLLWIEHGFLFHSLCLFPTLLFIWELGFDVKSLNPILLPILEDKWHIMKFFMSQNLFSIIMFCYRSF